LPYEAFSQRSQTNEMIYRPPGTLQSSHERIIVTVQSWSESDHKFIGLCVVMTSLTGAARCAVFSSFNASVVRQLPQLL